MDPDEIGRRTGRRLPAVRVEKRGEGRDGFLRTVIENAISAYINKMHGIYRKNNGTIRIIVRK